MNEDQMDETPNYWSVIPASVRYDSKLSSSAKLLYAEISCLCNAKGYCWATNKYFAKLYKKHNKTVSRWISRLESQGHIRTQGDGLNENRVIYLTQKCYAPGNKNATIGNKNATQNNKTVGRQSIAPLNKKPTVGRDCSLTDQNKEKPSLRGKNLKGKIKPNSLNEVLTHCSLNNIDLKIGKKFWIKMQQAGWLLADGSPVFDWEKLLNSWQEQDDKLKSKVKTKKDKVSVLIKPLLVKRYKQIDNSTHEHLNWSYKCGCSAVFEWDEVVYTNNKACCPSCGKFITREK